MSERVTRLVASSCTRALCGARTSAAKTGSDASGPDCNDSVIASFAGIGFCALIGSEIFAVDPVVRSTGSARLIAVAAGAGVGTACVLCTLNAAGVGTAGAAYATGVGDAGELVGGVLPGAFTFELLHPTTVRAIEATANERYKRKFIVRLPFSMHYEA